MGSSGKNCNNCGTVLKGDFCHQCGQEKLDYHVSFGHLLSHFLGDYFSFDSKLFKSLRPLLVKPGFLTEEYMSGHRVRYIPPVRLYVFISILYFILAAYRPITIKDVKEIDLSGDVSSAIEEISRDTKAQEDIEIKHTIAPPLVIADDDGLEHSLVEKLKTLENNVGELQDNFERNLPKIMFFLLPVFALLLKLIYVRSKRLLIEHFVFTLHFHAFAFLILALEVSIRIILSNSAPHWLFDLFNIPILLYLVLAMKRFYKQTIGKTLPKFLLLLMGYMFFIGFSIAGLAVYTFLML